MSIGDVFRLSCTWSDSSLVNINVNVFHFRQDTALVLDTEFEDLEERFVAEVSASYRALVSASLTLRTISVRTLTFPVTGQDFSPSGLTGTLSGAQNLPRQIAPVLSWRTGFIGKSFRGRTFVPTITEDHQNDGTLIGSYLTAMTAFGNAVIGMSGTSLEFAEWTPVVHSEKLSLNTPITGFIAQPVVGVQRRRKFGAGA